MPPSLHKSQSPSAMTAPMTPSKFHHSGTNNNSTPHNSTSSGSNSNSTNNTSCSGRRKDKHKNKHNNNNNNTSFLKSLYCPMTDTTYEGEVRYNTNINMSININMDMNTNTNTKMGTANNNSNCSSNSTSSLSSPTPTSSSSKSKSKSKKQQQLIKMNHQNQIQHPQSQSQSQFIIKHGQGTIHNHRDNTTIRGYFSNNELVGHALQTFYDERGVCAIAQYEGSFTTVNVEQQHHHHQQQQQQQYPSSNQNQNPNQFHTNYLRHGFGKYSWPLTGDEYVGEFYHGVMQGKGTFTWGSTGDRYEGKWYKGRMHGSHGRKLSLSTGDDFIGSFVKGKATGWGKKMFACGDVHCGMYRKNKRHGFGVYTWSNGDEYVGQWVAGRMVGRGIKSVCPIGIGTGSNNRNNIHDDDDDDNVEDIMLPGIGIGGRGRHGNDLMEVFYGTLVNDMAQGYGVKYYACGDVYCGQYYNNRRDIYGVYTWSNGEEYTGEWANGHMCGIGVKRMTNGDVYDGEFFNDEANGFGVKTFGSNGDIHYGEYQNNLRHGNGLYRWANGNEYEGNYVKGEQSGLGCMRWNDGAMTFCGRWKSGTKHGPGFLRILVRNQNPTVSSNVVQERVFFEVWSKGDRKFRQEIDYTWNDLPPIENIDFFHSWKWVWEDEREDNSTNSVNEDQSEGLLNVAEPHATVPVLENERANFDPVADEHERDPSLSDVRNIVQRRESLDEVVPTRRHFSVDFYSSVLEDDEQTLTKPRSYSFSSNRCSRRCSSKKVQHIRGGFIVISTIRKKIRISGELLSPRENYHGGKVPY